MTSSTTALTRRRPDDVSVHAQALRAAQCARCMWRHTVACDTAQPRAACASCRVARTARVFCPRSYSHRVHGARGSTQLIMHGSDAMARPVSCCVEGFWPYLCVELPANHGASAVRTLVRRIDDALHLMFAYANTRTDSDDEQEPEWSVRRRERLHSNAAPLDCQWCAPLKQHVLGYTLLRAYREFSRALSAVAPKRPHAIRAWDVAAHDVDQAASMVEMDEEAACALVSCECIMSGIPVVGAASASDDTERGFRLEYLDARTQPRFAKLRVRWPQLVRLVADMLDARANKSFEQLVRTLCQDRQRDREQREAESATTTPSSSTTRSVRMQRDAKRSRMTFGATAMEEDDEPVVGIDDDPNVPDDAFGVLNMDDEDDMTSATTMHFDLDDMRASERRSWCARRVTGLESVFAPLVVQCERAANGTAVAHWPRVFDADLDYELRFCVDSGANPEQWLEYRRIDAHVVPARAEHTVECVHVHVAHPTHLRRVSDTALLPYYCDIGSVAAADTAPEALADTLPPQLCVSFDIETRFLASRDILDATTDKQVLCVSMVLFDSVHDAELAHTRTLSFMWDQGAARASVRAGTTTMSSSSSLCACDAHDQTFCFVDEANMLAAVCGVMRMLQPDMVTGWNIESFDYAFLVRRWQYLHLSTAVPSTTTHTVCNHCAELPSASCHEYNRMLYMARDTSAAAHLCPLCESSSSTAVPSTGASWSSPQDAVWRERKVSVRACEFHSSAHGTQTGTKVTGQGLWVLDLLVHFKRSTAFRLRSYALGHVAHELLHDRKDDVPYSTINALFDSGDAEQRARLVRYCVKDARLPAQLLAKYVMHLEMVELARASGVPVDAICRRGLQIRSKTLLYREAQEHECGRHFFLRRSRHRIVDGTQPSIAATYAGGYVTEPERGLHLDVVATLDFASLYPSLMVTHNLCPSTVWRARDSVPPDVLHEHCWVPDDASSTGFVRASLYRGLVPTIQMKLLARRRDAKRKKKVAERAGLAHLVRVYDKQQLTKKLQSNGLYGVFGASTFFCASSETAARVTEEGRRAIQWTAALVPQYFDGDAGVATVVYGDTDSVFVRFNGERDLVRAARTGLALAQWITQQFRVRYGERDDNILVLEWEKMFSKLMLFAKKRYAGVKWELRSGNDDDDAMRARLYTSGKVSSSGMEQVRREVVPLVAHGVAHILDLLLLPRVDDCVVDDCNTDDGNAVVNTTTTQSSSSSERERVARLNDVRQYVLEHMIAPIRAGTVNFADIIQTKQLRKRVQDYGANAIVPVHVHLVERMAQRRARAIAVDDATASSTMVEMVPEPGDRVAYVMVSSASGGLQAKLSQCAETPERAWRNNMQLHQAYYIDRCVKQTLARTLEPLLASPTVLASMTSETKRQRYKTDALNAFLTTTNSIALNVAPVPPQRARTSAFGTVVAPCRRCVLCKVRLAATRAHAWCDAHSAAEVERYTSSVQTERARVLEERKRLYGVCQTCVGMCDVEDLATTTTSLDALTPCTNSSCDVYWVRLRNDRMSGAEVVP